MANAIRFKHTLAPRQPTERARLRVISGPDQEAIYVVTASNAMIGRGEENDIVIGDLRASRIHALLSVTPQGYLVEDKSTSNGIIINGEAVKRVSLRLGDVFTLGETTFQFVAQDVGSSQNTSQIRSQTQILDEHKRYNALSARSSSIRGGSVQDSDLLQSKSARLVGFALVLLTVIFIYFEYIDSPGLTTGEVKKESIESGTNSPEITNLAAYLPRSKPSKTAVILFKDGVREFFDGNYNRAKTQFETVLQIRPDYPLARVYLDKCINAVKDEVNARMVLGSKTLNSGKLRESRSHYDRVMRLLSRDLMNPNYIEAKEQYEKISQKMRADGDSNP